MRVSCVGRTMIDEKIGLEKYYRKSFCGLPIKITRIYSPSLTHQEKLDQNESDIFQDVFLI